MRCIRIWGKVTPMRGCAQVSGPGPGCPVLWNNTTWCCVDSCSGNWPAGLRIDWVTMLVESVLRSTQRDTDKPGSGVESAETHLTVSMQSPPNQRNPRFLPHSTLFDPTLRKWAHLLHQVQECLSMGRARETGVIMVMAVHIKP